MKNDIKTKSTDFLPQKPGLGDATAPTSATNPPSPATPAAPTANDLPPGAPTPSKHVIDLKNANNDTAAPATNKADVAEKNPFLLGKKSPQDLKVEPASAEASPKLPDAPMPEPSNTPELAKEAAAQGDTKTAEPGTAPNMDLAHPESDQPAEKDALKDAMVSEDATAKKPKKKLPTWLMVVIIVVAVILIGVITFAVLNAVAKPTGL